MGKEQELLEAARTGHLPAVEKLLSGKRLSSGFGGGGGGSGGGSGGGGGSSSHPLSSLLRWVMRRGRPAAWGPVSWVPGEIEAPETRTGWVFWVPRGESRRPTGQGTQVQVGVMPDSPCLVSRPGYEEWWECPGGSLCGMV